MNTYTYTHRSTHTYIIYININNDITSQILNPRIMKRKKIDPPLQKFFSKTLTSVVALFNPDCFHQLCASSVVLSNAFSKVCDPPSDGENALFFRNDIFRVLFWRNARTLTIVSVNVQCRVIPSSESLANNKILLLSAIKAIFCLCYQEAPRGGDSMLPNLKQKKQRRAHFPYSPQYPIQYQISNTTTYNHAISDTMLRHTS